MSNEPKKFDLNYNIGESIHLLHYKMYTMVKDITSVVLNY